MVLVEDFGVTTENVEKSWFWGQLRVTNGLHCSWVETGRRAIYWKHYTKKRKKESK